MSALALLSVSLHDARAKSASGQEEVVKIGIPRRRKTIGVAVGLIVAAGVAMAVVPGTAEAHIEGARTFAGSAGSPTVGATSAGVALSVVSGQQIYKCTQQPDGTFAFKQDNVDATLDQGIKHSFVTAGSGPPQWVAPDGSAVTGTVVSSTPHGDGNIPELKLTATQSGSPTGLLSNVVEVDRINTTGGVAPPGPCDPNVNPTAAVPYTAKYLFVQGG